MWPGTQRRSVLDLQVGGAGLGGAYTMHGSSSTTCQLQPRPPHLRRLPKVVTLHVSIFCEVALMARWISDESGSSG